MSHSTPQSPVMPSSWSRRSSGHSMTNPLKSAHSRRSSVQSQNSPMTPWRPSSAMNGSRDSEYGLDGAIPEGVGNLAAELGGDGWDEEEEEEEEEEELGEAESPYIKSPSPPTSTNSTTSKELADKTNGSASKHKRRKSGIKDNYDSDQDDIDESKIMSHELEYQMKLIETQAKQEITPADTIRDVFKRFEGQLQNLGSQIRVEEEATRLANSMNALQARLTDASRQIQSSFQTLLSPLSTPLDLDTITELKTMIEDLRASIPAPPSTPLVALHALSTASTEAVSSLAVLNDNLYIAQQNTSQATQKLQSSRELVDTIQQEMHLADEGRHYHEVEDLEETLPRRTAAAACKDIMTGFGEACGSWRQKWFGTEAASSA